MSVQLPESLVATSLRDWSSAADEALALEEYELAAQLSQVILRRLPRHLASYQRLLEITWHLRRWDEGEDWGRRLLQADPANALAWRALGRAAEQRDLRSQAHAIYRRAFEAEPYEPEVRAGLGRTGLDAERNPELNLACLGALYRKGRRWSHAVGVYRTLVETEPRRIDFQVLLAFALWQTRTHRNLHREAHALARRLTRAHPNLLLGWIVLDALGNENDRALARNPLESMDPDQEYLQWVYDLPATAPSTRLAVTPAEARLLEEFVQAAGFVEESPGAHEPEQDESVDDQTEQDEPEADEFVSDELAAGAPFVSDSVLDPAELDTSTSGLSDASDLPATSDLPDANASNNDQSDNDQSDVNRPDDDLAPRSTAS